MLNLVRAIGVNCCKLDLHNLRYVIRLRFIISNGILSYATKGLNDVSGCERGL
jgi:hypothetical protein